MIIWYKRRRWIKRVMKDLDSTSEKYKFLDRMQFVMKILNNLQYGMIQ